MSSTKLYENNKMWKGEIQVKCLNTFPYRGKTKKRKKNEISNLYTVHPIPGFETLKNDIAIVVQRQEDIFQAEIVSFQEITKDRDASKILPRVKFDEQLSIDKDSYEYEENPSYFPLRLCHLKVVMLNKEKLAEFFGEEYSVPNLSETSFQKFIKIDLFYCKGRQFSKYKQQKRLGEKLFNFVLAQYELEKFPIVLEADTRDRNATQTHKLFQYYKSLGFDHGPFPLIKNQDYSTAIMYRLPPSTTFTKS